MATKRDFSQVAHDVMMRATGQTPAKKAPSAKQLAGRAGGLAGGKKRMADMTEDERTALAMKGVAGRKKASADRAEAGAPAKR